MNRTGSTTSRFTGEWLDDYTCLCYEESVWDTTLTPGLCGVARASRWWMQTRGVVSICLFVSFVLFKLVIDKQCKAILK